MAAAPERLKILFVDDEPRILQGLNRMLFSMRKEWDMVFAAGGEAALRALETGGYHMLVTDLNMPGMEGTELLRIVRERYPGIIRIILSGSTQSETGLQTVQLAHQYLAKPCNAEELKAVITRSRSLRALFVRKGIMTTVSRIESLPSVPAVYEELLQELSSERSSAASVGAIIERDAGMCAKVLQLVNSAFFGLRREVERPAQAVNYLGMETVKSLALSAHVFHHFTGSSILGQSFEAFMNHCLETGHIARAAAQRHTTDKVMPEHALLAGLLHDLGKLVLAQEFPDEYQRVLGAVVERQCPVSEAEHDSFGATHAEIGAYLMGLWGLPDPVVEAIAFHHEPSRHVSGAVLPLGYVHGADAAEHRTHAVPGLPQPGLDTAFLQVCGLPVDGTYWQDLTEEHG